MIQALEKPNDTQNTVKPLQELTVKHPVRTLNDFDTEIEKLLPTAGTITLSEQERQTLYRPVDEADIEIRPDGLIYLPWTEYMIRLRDAFGLNWALVPHGMPKMNGNHILWGFYLIIRGKLCGFAIGEQEYQPDNKRMSWGDACEGAKSNALMRLCKGLGMCMDLWKPSFVTAWKEKCAESYWDQKKGKYLWRKKQMAENRSQSTEVRDQRSDGNGKTSPNDFVGKIRNAESLTSLKEVWKTYYHYLEAFSPEEKDIILETKDRKKQEFITTERRQFFNGKR